MRTSVTAVALIALLVLAATPGRAQLDYSNFRNRSGLSLVGSAQIIDDMLRLTPGTPHKVGAAWHSSRQLIGDGFITRFKFRTSQPGGESDGVANGGDGIAFVIQDSDSGDTAIGFDGGQIGYGGISRSVAVEFDMWRNDYRDNNDPSHNHISVHTNDLGRNSSEHRYSLGMTSNIQELGDREVHDVVIIYRDKKLSIYVDDCTAPMLEVDVDISARLSLDSGFAWVGFTSGTASAWQNHDILSWSLSGIGMVPHGSAALCEGDSLVLMVPTVSGRCVWSNGSRDKSITVREPGEYSVTVQESGNCIEHTYTRNVSVTLVPAPNPVITTNRPPMLCPGDTVILDAGDGFETYRWLPTGARTRRIAVAADGDYAVTVTNKAGCSKTSALMKVGMRIPPTPSITAGSSLTICPGDSVTLDAGEGYRAYMWSNGKQTRRITVNAAGSFSVEVTDQHGCSGRSAPVEVTVGNRLQPVIGVNGPTEFCAGQGVRLDAGSGYASYSWSNGATTQTILADENRSYTVTVTARGGCRGTSMPVVVTVHPRPFPSITTNRPPVICDGQPVTLDAGAGYVSYRWSTGDTTRSIIVDAPGRYMVTVTNAEDCTGAATLDVVRGSIPVPVITPGGAIALCDNDSVTLDAGSGYAEYLWSNGATSSSIRVSEDGTFTVTVTSVEGCIAVSAPVTVTVRQGLNPVITPDGPLSFCTGGSVTLRAPEGFQSYLWSNGRTESSITVTSSGRYTVTVSDENGCRATSPAVEVVAGATLLPEITALGPTLICIGDSVVLQAPSGHAGYLWSTGERTRTIAVRAAGSYHVTVDDGGGCGGTSAAVVIQVRPGPAVPGIAESSGVLSTDPATSYQWYLEGLPIAGANGRQHTPASYGNYIVAVTDENGCTTLSVPYAYFNARSAISLPAIAAAPGAMVIVPLRLDSSHELDAQGAGRFRVTIRFNGSLLIPSSIISCCGTTQLVTVLSAGSDRVLTFEGVRPQGMSSGTLTEIEFRVAVGSSTASMLRIDSFQWIDADVAVTTANGLFQLDDICFTGGQRLVSADGAIELKPVRPNPVSGNAEVEFEIVEDGLTELFLVDALGNHVLTLGEGTMQAGRYLIPFNAAALPPGLYFCVLSTPTNRLTTSVNVMR